MKTAKLMMDLKKMFRRIKIYLANLPTDVMLIITQELKKLMDNIKDLVNQLKLL
jgi:GTP cyclohydrolase III